MKVLVKFGDNVTPVSRNVQQRVLAHSHLGLPPGQRAVLEFLRDNERASLRDIAAQFGWSGQNYAQAVLVALRKKGWVTWVPGKARTLMVSR